MKYNQHVSLEVGCSNVIFHYITCKNMAYFNIKLHTIKTSERWSLIAPFPGQDW